MISLLRPEPGSSFSDLWYRVASSRPRLGTHCQVVRQFFGRGTVFVVEDPAGGQYYRLSESAYFFLGLLNGERTVDEAWTACSTQLGDRAPTQRECVELLSRLQLFGLLAGDLPQSPELVEARRRQATLQRVKTRTGFGFSITIPFLNPDPFLERCKHILALVFSKWGFAVWLGVVAVGLYHVLTNFSRLFENLNTVVDPSNLLILGVVFTFLRAWHELGHAAAAKAMGARSTEIGLILLLLILPFPYCDTSSAWRLPQVWKRVVVSAGGILFESVIASAAAVVWAHTNDPSIRSICYSVMFISGFSTLLFNLNPLLRYDGYYMLSDLTGTPNLWQRSREVWKFLLERIAFGIPAVRPPNVRNASEFWFLLAYGALSLPYRLTVTFSIILFIWSNPAYLTLGAVLAAISVVSFAVWPLVRSAWYLATSPALLGRRARALGLVGAAIGAVFVLLAFIPMPACVYAPGVTRADMQEPARATEDGFIDEMFVAAGQHVKAGDALFRLRNAGLAAERDATVSRLARAESELDEASMHSAADREVALKRVALAKAESERARSRVEGLTSHATADGVVVPNGGTSSELSNSIGRYVAKGTLLMTIQSLDRILVRAVVSDHDQAYVFRRGTLGAPDQFGVTPSFRIKGHASHTYRATLVSIAPAGSRQLDSRALTANAGGDIVLDPNDPKQQTSLVPQFVIEVRALPNEEKPERQIPVGVRARVRLAIAPEPLVQQWWRRAIQVFGDRSQL